MSPACHAIALLEERHAGRLPDAFSFTLVDIQEARGEQPLEDFTRDLVAELTARDFTVQVTRDLYQRSFACSQPPQ